MLEIQLRHLVTTHTLIQEAQLSPRNRTTRSVSVKSVQNVTQMFVEFHLVSPTLSELPSR